MIRSTILKMKLIQNIFLKKIIKMNFPHNKILKIIKMIDQIFKI